MNTYCAVLMDVISIQKYIFSSNELRNNLGASHIVKTLFEDKAVEAINMACNIYDEDKVRTIMAEWRNSPDKILMKDDKSIPFEIGVSGGGKALIFFREEDMARKFIKNFTKSLLINAPGLQLAVAVDEEFSLDQPFSRQLEQLFAQMTKNRNQYFPVTTLPVHSITATNPESETMNIYSKHTQKHVDYKTAAKEAAEKEVREKLRQDYAELLKGYSLTLRVDQLAQEAGDSYTAIVHVDGNGVGNWFIGSSSLADYRTRSLNMERITEESFRTVIAAVVDMLGDLKNTPGFNIQDNLPLRPIILGGDDLTFICHGKLGLYLAEKFINIWIQKANQGLNDLPAGGFSACAGVAIAKTKYPFYRTYQIAEELCSLAKECHRKEGGSWLDFYLISGTKSGNVNSIREAEGRDHIYQLYFGPYMIDTESDKGKHEKAIDHLLGGLRGFYKDSFWTNPHLKELRTAFFSGPEVLNTLLIDMVARGGHLPKYGNYAYSEKGYVDEKTPYLDMLEIMEFYPRILLERR